MIVDRSLREAVIALAREAGAAVLRVYRQDFAVTHKSDGSPLTQADLAAQRILLAGLSALPPVLPVVSEEAAAPPWSERRQWSRYWLIDPLDGTREFVARNDEFTVNIALIERGAPVFGVICAPALDYLAYGVCGEGAWRRLADSREEAISVQQPAPPALRAAVSRSHPDARTSELLMRLGIEERISAGSSLKFCYMAEGRADIYPRFGTTCEWDTAAGQCILEAAGGAVLDLDGKPLRYNTSASLRNPDFIALGDTSLAARLKAAVSALAASPNRETEPSPLPPGEGQG